MHIERDRNARTIFLNQTRYITMLLERFGMRDCKGSSTPMEAAPLPPCPPNINEAVNRVEYQSKVGNIMYAMLGTHPDLAYAVSALSKFNSCPITAHHSAMGRVLRYLQTTKNMGILYKGEPNSTSAIPECYGPPALYTFPTPYAFPASTCLMPLNPLPPSGKKNFVWVHPTRLEGCSASGASVTPVGTVTSFV